MDNNSNTSSFFDAHSDPTDSPRSDMFDTPRNPFQAAPRAQTQQARFFCHQCRQSILAREEDPQCPHCGDGFVELVTNQDNPQEWDQPDPLNHDLGALLHLLGIMQEHEGDRARGPRVISLRRGPGPMRITDLPHPSIHNNNNTNNHNNPQARPIPFSQLLMMMMGMTQNQAGDPGLDALIARMMENDPNRWGSPPASTAAVQALKIVHITQEHVENSTECSVCMDAFELADETLQMPCNHLFHNKCIKSWLDQHNSCPVCRFELPTDDSDYERVRVRREAERQQQQQQQQRGRPVTSTSSTATTTTATTTNSNGASNSNAGHHSSSLSRLFSRRRRSSGRPEEP